MNTIYLFCAIVGGGLMVFSAVSAGMGHGHGDADLDFDSDTDASASDFDNGGQKGGFENLVAWIPFTSLRFWIFALGTFGLMGWVCTFFNLSKEPTIAIASGATGFAVGTTVSILWRLFTTKMTGDYIGANDFCGVEGRVLVTVSPNSLGKVRVTVKGDIIDLIAKNREGLTISQNANVVVTDFEDNIAYVMPLESLLEEQSQLPN